MKRIEILHALAAANNAFNAVLKKNGIELTGFNLNHPNDYYMYVCNNPGEGPEIIGKITYKQEIEEEID